MTYFQDVNASFVDGPNFTAFSRLRTSHPYVLFDFQAQYDKGPLLWEETLTGGGTSTHLPNESSIRLRVSTSGDKVVRQTYQYFHYKPGRSQLVFDTFVLGEDSNVRRRVGLFDANNGVFVENDGTNTKFVIRSYTSGSPVDTAVAQSSWNLDTLDGTGPSGIELDVTKTQILVIDAQWLGVGRVRFGFDIGGVVVYAHEALHANSATAVYSSTLNLPVRYEIEATGTPAGASDLTVISEGGTNIDTGTVWSANTGTTAKTMNTRAAVISIRPKTTFNSITNRAQVNPLSFNLSLWTADILLWEIVAGHSLGGTPSWTSANTNSVVEYDIAGTTITGGQTLASGYLGSDGKVSTDAAFSASDFGIIPPALSLNAAGTTAQIMSLVITNFTGDCDVSGSLMWTEVR